jgi:hypothetical protein
MHARKIQRLQELWINSLTIRTEDESDYILNVTWGNGAYGYFILIVDVKMEDFRCKSRFVARGHTMEIPHAMMYAIGVKQYSSHWPLLV